jgi:hypothetical protein
MILMRKTTISFMSLLLLAGSIFALTACSQDAPAPSGTLKANQMTEYGPRAAEQFTVILKDGRTLECVYVSRESGGGSTGGPSCDWANAK